MDCLKQEEKSKTRITQDETLKVSSDSYSFPPWRSSPSLSAMRNLSDTKRFQAYQPPALVFGVIFFPSLPDLLL
jgi:hypothetical protein